MIDCPVYSLATVVDGHVNMNICTYVTAVSMKPKMYAIALDPETKTFHNLSLDQEPTLQLLGKENISTIKSLGKRSGFKYDKDRFLKKKDLITQWKGRDVLKHAAAYLKLRTRGKAETGDHHLFWLEVIGFKSNHDQVLSFQDLIKERIIL